MSDGAIGRQSRYRLLAAVACLLSLPGPSRAQQGVPMNPERLDSLTQLRTVDLRVRKLNLTQILPPITQQMFYRIHLTPEAPDPTLSVFCSGARLSQFEHATIALFGYRLVGRSQGEGMGLVFAPDPAAVAAAARRRLQGRAALEAGIAQAGEWLRQPEALGTIARTRCPGAASLEADQVKRAFRLHGALTRSQRAVVLAGHPVVLPYAALPASSRTLLPAGKPVPKWLTFYLYQDPWTADSEPRLAVRAEPSGETWLSCPPMALVPAHFPNAGSVDPALKAALKGALDLGDLDPGEEAGTILEWLADQRSIWIMAEALRLPASGGESFKKLAASLAGLSLEEALDKTAAFFDATWRLDDGWVLIQRRSTHGG